MFYLFSFSYISFHLFHFHMFTFIFEIILFFSSTLKPKSYIFISNYKNKNLFLICSSEENVSNLQIGISFYQIIKRKTYFWICNSEGKASNLKVGVHVPNIYQFPLKGDIYLPTLNNVTLLMYLPSVGLSDPGTRNRKSGIFHVRILSEMRTFLLPDLGLFSNKKIL